MEHNQKTSYWNKPIQTGSLIEFNYTNHTGVFSRRCVLVKTISFGMYPDYYETPRMLLTGYCLDKAAYRTFDMGQIKELDVKSF